MSWWFKVAIALCGGFATVAVGLKPLIERVGNVKLDTSAAAAAIIFTGTLGTLSGLNAFAETQGSLLQHERTLAQLQQLHWRMSTTFLQPQTYAKTMRISGRLVLEISV